MSVIDMVLEAGDELGEGPFWDERSEQLIRVDITLGRVHGWSPSSGATWSREYDAEVSAVVPRLAEDGWIVAAGHRILLDDGDGLPELAVVERDRPDNRFNDCKCDPQGRLWAGTMSKRRSTGEASLYRLTPGRPIERVIEGTTISNGLGWSPEGDLMYFIDSTTQRVDVLDFHADDGGVENRRPFAEIDAADGLPDGMAVDAEGGIWVCLFGGGAVRRYASDGALDAVIPLPVTNPTCPVFGGDGLRTLYLTSARHRLTERQLAAEPLAGAVLALEPGVSGRPGHRFRG